MTPDNQGITGTNGYSVTLRRNLCLAAAAILAPFVVNNLLVGDPVGASIVIGLILVLLVSAWSLHAKQKSVWRGSLVLCLAVAAVAWTISARGPVGGYWAYPVILLFHLLLDRKRAMMGTLIFVAAVVPLVWWSGGPGMGIRILSTLFLTSWFCYIFSARHERQQAHLRELIRVDHLTGCYNRRHFEDCVAEATASKRRYLRPVSAVLFDIDHFKDINDNYGHKVGDEVIRWVADTVRHRIRTADGLFRYGGDEFVVLMPQTDLHHAAQVAEDLRALIVSAESPFEFSLSVSIGVSELCRDEDPESWLRRADHALYKAKNEGRDKVNVSPSTIVVNQ